jgi:hypothetical protein
MKTFRAELLLNHGVYDYMEFESDSSSNAKEYATSRFLSAYPFIIAYSVVVKEI